jgi:hypothetical protein
MGGLLRRYFSSRKGFNTGISGVLLIDSAHTMRDRVAARFEQVPDFIVANACAELISTVAAFRCEGEQLVWLVVVLTL